MLNERWGGFSVKDHIDAAALAAEVLLYDRLLLPVPSDKAEEERWKDEHWEPELQKNRLGVLGDLAESVKWDESRQRTYQIELDKLRERGLKVNGYRLTAAVIAGETRGVDVDVVAAYHSESAFHTDFPEENDLNKQAYVAYLLGQRFAVPAGNSEAALKQAVKVAKNPEFKEHRAAMYAWQRDMIEQKIAPLDAVKQMDELLKKYNKCVEKAAKDVYYKFGFTVAGVVLGLAAAPASPWAAGGALLTMTQFAKMDTKPSVNAAPYGPAAMFHEFANAQKPFWDWTKHT